MTVNISVVNKNYEKGKRIHNLDTLDSEIYRLELKAKHAEQGLKESFGRAKRRIPTLLLRSFFRRKEQKETLVEAFLEKLFTRFRGTKEK